MFVSKKVFLMFLTPLFSKGQIVNIINTEILQNEVLITYNLTASSKINLQFSNDNGPFNIITGKGDIGNLVRRGEKLKILYSPQESFYCKNCIFRIVAEKVPVIIDKRDNQEYLIKNYQDITWMTENLRYDNTEILKQLTSIYMPADYFQKYGRLYNWEFAKNACPSGWHLPSIEEWNKLIRLNGGSFSAGDNLKSNSDWLENGYGSNLSGFNALPGGYFENEVLNFTGTMGSWWTNSAEISSLYATSTYMLSSSSFVKYNEESSKLSHRSVRCVRDY
jgi:uncharacterized protein (TIGR02145 family)